MSTPSKNSCDIRLLHLGRGHRVALCENVGWKLAVSQWRDFHNRLMLRRFLRLSWRIDTKNWLRVTICNIAAMLRLKYIQELALRRSVQA